MGVKWRSPLKCTEFSPLANLRNKMNCLYQTFFFALAACSNPAKQVTIGNHCILDIHNELEQSAKDLDALRLGYHRSESDPKKVFLVAVGMSREERGRINDLTFMDAMRTSRNVDCQLVKHESELFVANSVLLDDNIQHLRSVKSRLGVNPDTVMVLALMDSTHSLKRIYIGGGEHTVKVVDVE